MTIPPIATARLPRNYDNAVRELRACARQFTPARYYLASLALKECADVDECAEWPQDISLFSTYARMERESAKSGELTRLIKRVERARKRWLIECGFELPEQSDATRTAAAATERRDG